MKTIEEIIEKYKLELKNLKVEFKAKVFQKLVEAGIKEPEDDYMDEEFLSEVFENQTLKNKL